MSVIDDKESIRNAYTDVRDDKSDVNWAVLKYDDKKIVLDSTGSEYAEFVSKFTDDERVFGFVRVVAGDEMSKRVKFVLITWQGANIGGLKKAKMSTDKGFVKEIIQSFAMEMLATDISEIEEDNLRAALTKSGGANYGTGI